ncbi:uncharacterized protein SAPINGB_P003688 [Magnusiomyces paraingens]|uniref:Calcineurin-like phosphoesterase domain-containing protein n=1 Tax=Magnusiomyces paraingens TaxID=2606893 RepID=A0A5E8BY34_9ASCO|nr:uncharacterized protein SAPINGB_P003688 [Saprochaete ingens]VVT53665.1 unnamed protein product [Saprochaete ingens]
MIYKLQSTFTVVLLLLLSLVTAQQQADKTPNFSEENEELIRASISQLNKIMKKSSIDSCEKCVSALELGHELAKKADAGVVTEIMTRFCRKHKKSKHAKARCDYKFGLSTVNGSAFGDDITNVLTLIKPRSLDGKYICNHFLKGACPMPETPNFDLSSWWPKKPKNARQPDASGETFNVVHISDFHVDLDYETGTESNCTQSMCCNEWKYNEASHNIVLQPAQAYGSYQCDAPNSLLQSSLENVAEINKDKNFEFAIFTGDMVDHDDTQYLTLENAIATEKLVYSSMKKHMNIPVYVTLGNHDTYPYAQIAQEKSGFVNRFSWNTDLAYEMWTDSNWMTEEEAANVKDHYTAFAVTTKRGLRVISLNANLWFKENYYNYWGTDTDPDPSGLFRFLSDQLLDCEKNGQRAWVMAHVPMGGETSEAHPPATQVFNQIMERFSPHVVAGIFFGHTHRDEFTVMYAKNATEKTEENALNVAFLDESVTPYKFLNPGWRYYEIDAKTFQVINIHHYYTRLNDSFTEVPSANDTEAIKLKWEYEYSSRDAYDPEGLWPKEAPLNATFWHHVVNKIRDSAYYRKLYLEYSYRRSPYVPECTHWNCVKKLYCYITSSTVPQVQTCMMEEQYTPNGDISILGALLWVISFVIIFGVLGLGLYYWFAHHEFPYVKKVPHSNRRDYISLN